MVGIIRNITPRGKLRNLRTFEILGIIPPSAAATSAISPLRPLRGRSGADARYPKLVTLEISPLGEK